MSRRTSNAQARPAGGGGKRPTPLYVYCGSKCAASLWGGKGSERTFENSLYRQSLALQQAFLGRDKSHSKHLVDEEIRSLDANWVVLLEKLQLGGKFSDETCDFAIFDIVVAVLHVVPSQNLDLTNILVTFPLQEVDLLQQLLLVELQLPHSRVLST